jgi:hypothetical protein
MIAFFLVIEHACLAAIHVDVANASPQAEFAAEEIRTAAQRTKADGDWRVTLGLLAGDNSSAIAPEGFRIARSTRDNVQQIDILASDPAAAQLAIFRESKNEVARSAAVGHLVDAALHWHDYTSMALEHHKNPLWTNRVGYVDWKKNYQYALEDIRIAGGDPSAHGLPASFQAEGEPVVRPNATADDR